MAKHLAENDSGKLEKAHLAQAFAYQHATVSEAELLERHAGFAEVISWAKDEQLIEYADEEGRLRLTPTGRRFWRQTMEEN